jgi:hypothetical protein
VPNVFIQGCEIKLTHVTPCKAELVQSMCFLTVVNAYRAEEGTNESSLDPWTLVDDEGLEVGKMAFGREKSTSTTKQKALSRESRGSAVHFHRAQVVSDMR